MTGLAIYAIRNNQSRGRIYPEPEHVYRSPFARDRDRVIHSRAFRRLEYKTQVFVNHEGDHYRTRLTHSIEVAQITRTVAGTLGLNADLAECLALCHDLGHPPFGHSGQDVLDEMMKNHGGFEHNLQTLRIVEYLEEKYINFPGLNLTFESREGIVKHGAHYDRPQGPPSFLKIYDLDRRPPLEAQIVDLCDEIAYCNHDLDDGLESKLLDPHELTESVPFFGEIFRKVRAEHPAARLALVNNETIIRLINLLVTDLIDTVQQNIRENRIESLEDVRNAPALLASFSDGVREQNQSLKDYLFDRMYNHYRVNRMKNKAKRILQALFQAYRDDPSLLPARHREKMKAEGKERIICDYIAGMTDRFAIEEYGKLFDPREKV